MTPSNDQGVDRALVAALGTALLGALILFILPIVQSGGLHPMPRAALLLCAIASGFSTFAVAIKEGCPLVVSTVFAVAVPAGLISFFWLMLMLGSLILGLEF